MFLKTLYFPILGIFFFKKKNEFHELILNICSGQYLSVKLGKRKTKRKKESLDLLWWLQTGQLLHLKFVIQTSVCVGPILIRGTILCYKCMYSHA
jgi:hypothetical protein